MDLAVLHWNCDPRFEGWRQVKGTLELLDVGQIHFCCSGGVVCLTDYHAGAYCFGTISVYQLADWVIGELLKQRLLNENQVSQIACKAVSCELCVLDCMLLYGASGLHVLVVQFFCCCYTGNSLSIRWQTQTIYASNAPFLRLNTCSASGVFCINIKLATMLTPRFYLMVLWLMLAVDDMFWNDTFSLEEDIEWCVKNVGTLPRPLWATIQWGGRKISTASNIVFSNGEYDPWRGGGITTSLSESLVAVIIKEVWDVELEDLRRSQLLEIFAVPCDLLPLNTKL